MSLAGESGEDVITAGQPESTHGLQPVPTAGLDNFSTELNLSGLKDWRRQWHPIPVFLPGKSQRRGSLLGCRVWGPQSGHDWSDLAVAVVAASKIVPKGTLKSERIQSGSHWQTAWG